MHQMHIRGSIRGLYQAKRGGYLAVSLWKDNKGRTRPVHALVAEAFIGPRPDGMEVRHLDGDPLNPHASNLAYGTSLENKADMRRHGTHGNAKKTHCPQGHEYTPENTHRNDKGYRWCRTCIRKRNARSAA